CRANQEKKRKPDFFINLRPTHFTGNENSVGIPIRYSNDSQISHPFPSPEPEYIGQRECSGDAAGKCFAFRCVF
ncbi:MAG: hypothetical protein WAN90_04630, partial [Dysgonamonadaceae bacterium]